MEAASARTAFHGSKEPFLSSSFFSFGSFNDYPSIRQIRQERIARPRQQNRYIDHLFFYLIQGHGIDQIDAGLHAIEEENAVLLPLFTFRTIYKDPKTDLKHSIVHFHLPQEQALNTPLILENIYQTTMFHSRMERLKQDSTLEKGHQDSQLRKCFLKYSQRVLARPRSRLFRHKMLCYGSLPNGLK
jgi:hypothetical protein